MPDLLTREVHIRTRAAETHDGEMAVFGLAVPYGETITVWGQRERFAPGSIDGAGAKLFERHTDPVGLVATGTDTDAGYEIKGVFSDTARARDAYSLTRDGVYDGLSVGFKAEEYHFERDDAGEVIVYDRVRVREVSLVPFPAYPSAKVTEVRHHEGETMTRTPTTPDETERTDDVRELREMVEDQGRILRGLGDRRDSSEPLADTRSAGAWLRDLASGDENTTREYEGLVERAYEGGTSADGILNPQWVGDTIRLFNTPDALSSIFSTGALPSKGLQLEYGVLEWDDVEVARQEAEGDDLVRGGIKVGLEHADIHTYGGHVEMTRQQIERTTNVNVLDLHLRALGLRGARRRATVLRELYAAVVADNLTNPDRVVTIDFADDYVSWIGGIIDAAEMFIDRGLPLEALVVDKTIFKTLATLSTGDRPLMDVSGSGPTQLGLINPTALGGRLTNLPVKVNLKQEDPGAAFVNGEAIRQYNGSVTELADENIVNLSKRFGLYYYGANAVEIPDAIVPVTFEG